MDGNYEKNEKTPPTSPTSPSGRKKRKIEKCSIYGDSYFLMNIGEVAKLANLTTNDSVPSLGINSTNSFSFGLKNEDIRLLCQFFSLSLLALLR